MKRLPIRLSARRRIAQAFGSEAQARRGKPTGQALLVILLIMAVALTIGLAITSRTVTDVEISGKTEEAARAFSAAEAGIEESLVTGIDAGGTFETGAEFHSAVARLGEGDSEFVFPDVSRNEIKTLYLANYGTDGTLTQSYIASSIELCWNDDAAIEATLYYDSGGYKVARYAVDSITRDPANNFELAESVGCAGLEHNKTLTFPAGTPLFLRIRVLYMDSVKVGVRTPGGVGGVLPAQGVKIVSTGEAGISTRKVEVIRMHPAPPGIFDFLLYSGGDLSK